MGEGEGEWEEEERAVEEVVGERAEEEERERDE